MDIRSAWAEKKAIMDAEGFTPDEREYVARHFLANNRKLLPTDQAQRKALIAEIKGIQQGGPAPKAVTNPVESFGRSFGHQMSNATLEGHVAHAATGTPIADQTDFYPQGLPAKAASIVGHYASQFAAPTNLIPIGKGVQAARGGIEGMKQVAGFGAKVGAGFAGVDSAAVQYANTGQVDPGQLAMDTGVGAAVGAGMGVAVPIVANKVAQRFPGLTQDLPNPFAAPQPSAMDRAGIPAHYQEFLRGGEMPRQVAPVQPAPPAAAIQQNPLAPPGYSQGLRLVQPDVQFQEVGIPSITDNQFTHTIITSGRPTPVKLVGTTPDGRVVVDDGVSRMTIAPQLLNDLGGGAFETPGRLTHAERFQQLEQMPMDPMPDPNTIVAGQDGPGPLADWWAAQQRANGPRPVQQPEAPGTYTSDYDPNPLVMGRPVTRGPGMQVAESPQSPALFEAFQDNPLAPQAVRSQQAQVPQAPAPRNVVIDSYGSVPRQARPGTGAPDAGPSRTVEAYGSVPRRVAQPTPAPEPVAAGRPRPQVPDEPPVVVSENAPEPPPPPTPRTPVEESTPHELSPHIKEYVDQMDAKGLAREIRAALKEEQTADTMAYLDYLRTRLAEVRSGKAQAPIAKAVGAPNHTPDLSTDAVGATSANPETKARDFVDNFLGGVGDSPSGDSHVGNVNLTTLGTEDELTAVIEAMVQHNQMAMQGAKRGTRTWDMSAEDATQILTGHDQAGLEKLKGLKKGDTVNDAEVVALATLVKRNAEQNLKPALDRVRGGDNSDEAVGALVEQVQAMNAIMAKAYGAKSEVGRALNAMKMVAQARRVGGQALAEALEALGGKSKYEVIGQALDGMTPQQQAHLIRQIEKPRFSDMVVEYVINSILSGFPTQAINAVGSGLNIASKIAETAAASIIGKGIHGRHAAVTMGEAKTQLFSVWRGMEEGAELAKVAFRTEESPLLGESVEGAPMVEGRQRAIPGKTGEVVRLPSRTLLTVDTFFKGILYRMELNGLAYREAIKGGGSSDDVSRRMTEILNDPSEELMMKAAHEARYRTFTDQLTNRNLQEVIGKAITKVKSGDQAFIVKLRSDPNKAKRILGGVVHDVNTVVVNLLVPFVRTPVKIVTAAQERSPLAPLDIQFLDDVTGNDNAAREMALAKMAVGAGLGYMFYTMAHSAIAGWSLSDGGPSDYRQRNLQQAAGFQPYSVKKEGSDDSYQIARLGQFGMLAGVMADLAVLAKENDEVKASEMIKTAVASMYKNVGEQTFWAGINDFMGAAKDPDRNLNDFIADRVRMFVPYTSLLGRYAGMEDSTIRETKSDDLERHIDQKIRSRLPVESKKLKPKLGPTGLPVERDQKGLEYFLSPFSKRTKSKDPVLVEIARLSKAGVPGMNINGPSNRMTLFRRQIELTEDEHYRLREIWGQELNKRLPRIVNSDGYKSMASDEMKARRIKRIVDSVSDKAQNLLVREYPELRKRAREEGVRR